MVLLKRFPHLCLPSRIGIDDACRRSQQEGGHKAINISNRLNLLRKIFTNRKIKEETLSKRVEKRLHSIGWSAGTTGGERSSSNM
jgi:hypothetical protein